MGESAGGKVCIIGAGPGGLSMARALKNRSIAYDQYERHSDAGGIWDLDNPATPMYRSAHFISSRTVSGFHDFPMPGTYPDYPGNRQILEYTRAFADAYGLREHITFGSAVERVESAGQDPDRDGWAVHLSGGSSKHYAAVVCATGTTWSPRMPVHPGEFGGEIRHANTYRDPDEFRGRRVLIVGLGNSGADIACDAAKLADAAFVSIRRGYHVIPKHLFGIPVDVIDEGGPDLPLWFERPVFQALLRLLEGDLTRLGLPKPDHKLFETHPLLNSEILHHLRHGDIAIRPDIARLDGREVVFADGTREQIDLILYATGYTWDIPYARDLFDWHDGRPDLYLTAFSRRYETLFALGYIETNSSVYTLMDHVSDLVGRYLEARRSDPARARAFRRDVARERPDLTGGIRFVRTPRAAGYVDSSAFKKHLAAVHRRHGWPDLSPGMIDAVRSRS